MQLKARPKYVLGKDINGNNTYSVIKFIFNQITVLVSQADEDFQILKRMGNHVKN